MIISKAMLDYIRLQIAEHEALTGPEMDEAEMFFVDTQLDDLICKLEIYSGSSNLTKTHIRT